MKGQAAVEFLMTYGWAFLIMIAVTAGTIALDPLSYTTQTTNTCTDNDFLICDDQRVKVTTKGETVFTYTNKGKETLTLQNVTIKQIQQEQVNTSTCTHPKQIQQGQTIQITCQTDKEIRSNKQLNIDYELNTYPTSLGKQYLKKQTSQAKATPQDTDTILTGTVLNLDFTQDNTIIPDKSLADNNGINGGGQPQNQPTWSKNCPLQGCYNFDGNNDYIAISADQTHDITGSLTVTAWMKSGQQNKWSSMWSGISKYKQFILGFPKNNNNGRVAFLIFTGSNWQPSGYGSKTWWSPPDITQWNHYAGTYNEETNQVKLYGNGELKQTYTVSGPPDSENSPIHIGHREIDNIGQNHLDASITGVKLYNRTLSPKEVRKLYNT